MAQKGKNIVDLEKEIQLIKEKNKVLREAQGTTNANNARIKGHLNDIEKLEARILRLKKASHEEAKASREETEKEVNAKGDLKNISLDLAKLANREARLAKSKKGILLESLGIDVKWSALRDKAAKKEAKGDALKTNALKELEKLRLDSLDALMADTFDKGEFDASLADIKTRLNKSTEGGISEGFEAVFDKMGDIGVNFETGGGVEDLREVLDGDYPILDMVEKVRNVAGEIRMAFKSVRMFALVAGGLLLNEIKKLVMQSKELRQDLGISAGEAGEMAYQMRRAQLSAFLVGGDMDKAKDSIKAFADVTSQATQLTGKMAGDLGKIASLAGSSAETTAELVLLNALATGTSLERSIAEVETLGNLAKQKKVLGSKVFEDVASAAKDTSFFMGKTADEIGRAAIEMRKLGVSVSAIEQVAEAMLDLEGSISNQFEQQALFGKTINFEKLRALSFSRDEEGLAKAIKSELRGQFDLQNMNAAQAKSLTKSIGLSAGQMTKLVNGQKVFTDETDEASEATSKIAKKMRMVGGIVGAVVGTLVALGPAIITALSRGKTIKQDLAAVGKGMMVIGTGAALGGAAGYGAGAAYSTFENLESDKKVSAVGINRKGVSDSQGVGISTSLGDNFYLSADKRTQQQLDLHTTKLEQKLDRLISATEKSGVTITKAVDSSTGFLSKVESGIRNIKR